MNSISLTEKRSAARKRYFQFALILLAAGAIYPLLYLRQNFELTILSSFDITSIELGELYTTLGVIYVVTYLPSGWLADKVSPRNLITFSLAAVGLLGLWFSTFPNKETLAYIFAGWGLAAGLTFWSALIKSVKMLASENEQGRFFGTLDGGRGLVEAVLATIVVGVFAWLVNGGGSPSSALQKVIYIYSFVCIAISVLIYLFLDKEKSAVDKKENVEGNLLTHMKILLSIPQVWMLAVIIFCGYQLFWATYSFSAYLQEGYEMTAVGVGYITVAKLWMRPIGGIGGGFLADKYSKETVLGLSILGSSVGLLCLTVFPKLNTIYFLLGLVLLLGILTYAIRGLYWSLLDSCKVPAYVLGLAIGFISIIGYLPDIFLPMINSALTEKYPGIASYQLYFSYIAICGFFGAAITFVFKKSVAKKGLVK